MRRASKIVYKVTNIVNNKSYIGWCVDFNERKARHLKAASNGVDTHFYAAIRKYGADNFTWEIVRTDLLSFDECKQLERELIVKYDSYYNGYNSTLGGDGGDTYSKLSEDRKKEFHQKCSENNSKFWKNKKFTEEHKRKLKISRKTQDMSYKRRPINQYDINGKMLHSWESISEASKNTGVYYSGISKAVIAALKGKKWKIGGFYWEYANI